MTTRPDLTQAEIEQICEPLVQPAAQVRFLKRLGLPVDRRPNGRPLVSRSAWERHLSGQTPTASASNPVNGPKWTVST